ncbi:MAG: glycosyltransferase family 4 protein [Acidimicrobiia bacterium]
MRIGLVCPYDLGRPGGVQQLCRELGNRLVAAGHEALLVGPGDGSGFVSVGKTLGIRGNRSVVPICLDPRSVSTTRAALEGVDVVHAHEPLIPLVGWAGLGRSSIPTVATFHAHPPGWVRFGYRWGAIVLRRRLRAVALTAVSQVAASAIPASWGPVTIVPNAIEASSYDRPVPRNRERVAFLGRDERRKGLDVLLRAWPEVRRLHPSAELIVLGASRPGTTPGVEFLGRVDEDTKRRTLASSAVFAAPHLGGESFGIVVAEAMAAGCAVVASDLDAFRAVLNGAGLLVPPGDSASLATAISGLLSNPTRASALGEMGRHRVQGYDWSSVTGRYIEIYESVVAAG